MAYIPLQLPSNTPTHLRELVEMRIDPMLRDIHTMFRLPIDGQEGLDAGCNLTITNSLLDIAAGVSMLREDIEQLDSTKPGMSGELFRRCLVKRYPWIEGPNATDVHPIDGLHAANVLYDVFRNPLTHSLGAIVGESGKSLKYGQPKAAKGPLEEAEIEAIERATTWIPEWRRPTLYTDSDRKQDRTKTVLVLKSFYWGVRQMIVGTVAELSVHPSTTTLAKKTMPVSATATSVYSGPIITRVNSSST